MKRGRQTHRSRKPLELHRAHENDQQQSAPIPTPLLLSPTEVARALGLGRSTIYELMRAGAFPSIHIGRSVRIPSKAVEAWVDQQASQSLS
jgi:excisionase family DNA binding protein